jgi:hypothetical protein
MPKLPTDYSKCVIYVIKCKDDNITEEYIGSTTNFTQRKNNHKTTCNNEKNKRYNELKYKFIRDNGGWDNWLMLEVLKYPCQDSNQARMKEEEIRLERKSKLNCYKAFLSNEVLKEEKKQYYEEHKEQYKQYYENHQEQYKFYRFKYNNENKEEEKQRCKVYREAHKEELKLLKQIWYINNKDKINEKHKLYREENKDKMNELNKKWREINKKLK